MKAQKDYIMPPPPPAPQSMDLNPLTLSFSRVLEAKFFDEYYQSSLGVVRLSLFAGIFFYGVFGVLDATLIPQMQRQLWFIRFAVVCPSLLGVILLSFHPLFKKYFQLLLTLSMGIAGLGIVAMISIIPPPISHFYYAGLILVFIWGYTFTRVRFVWATPTGWIIVLLYEIVAIWITKTPTNILVNNNFFFISANIIGMCVCYSIEYYTRKDFFLAHLLENEQEKIKAANLILEERIIERTAQLEKTNKELKLEIEERKRIQEDRKKLETKLIQAQKMEAIGTLAGGIAHDFNNLLMGIQGNASLALLDTELDHPHYSKLRNVERYVVKGSELTQQLLGFARGGKYKIKPTNLNELVEKSAKMFGTTKKEVKITKNFQENIWTVEIDQGQIEQALLNLFVNAWQAMPGGGNIHIQTKNVGLDEKFLKDLEYNLTPGEYVKISITDAGIGMDEATLQRIFDPFFTTKEKGMGTGLGLASVYGIIKNHGGFIQVSSEKLKGSTFKLYLPVSIKEVKKEEEREMEMINGNETVLLVDDEDMIIEVGGEMLETLGYKTFTARGGKEAVKVISDNSDKIKLVILDMIMPDMSGGEVFDIIKTNHPEIKILLSSGYSLDGQASDILKRGCEGFIQKPFDIKLISTEIRKILSVN